MLCPKCNLHWNAFGCGLCGLCVAHKSMNAEGLHECQFKPKIMTYGEMVMRRLEGTNPGD